MPDTLLGLLLFIGAIGPGYVWLRVAEVRRPQQQRTGIVEAVELAFVGLLATGLSALIVLVAVNEWEALGVDLRQMTQDGGRYLAVEPARGIGTVLAILVGGFALAFAAARLTHRGRQAAIKPGYSVWDDLFAIDDTAVKVYAALELRDGRGFAGYVYSWDVGTSEQDRELALHAPIFTRVGNGPATALGGPFEFVSVRRENVVWLSVAQDPSPLAARQRAGQT